jgi:uncharacterized repeat protein (TIGR01451 family)
LTFVSATPSQGSYNAATGVWTVGMVTTAASQTLQIVATVVSPNPGANSAAVMHADQFDPNGSNNSASVSLHVQSADLAVAKSVSTSTPNVGDTVTFTVTLTDAGPAAATNVAVADQLPTGLTFVSATPSQGTYNAATGVWTVGMVTTSTPETLAIQAKVVSPNPLTNTAAISHADQFDPVTANNTASATETPLQADLAVTKTVSDSSPNVGVTVTFTVTLTDAGPGDAMGVQVTDLLPAGLTMLTATPSQGTYNAATGLWDVGTVSPGSPQTLTIQTRVDSPTPQTNTATITHADQFDPVTANNTASATETPLQADLAVTKTVSNSTPNVGDTVTFTMTLSDNGPATATNVTVTDLLPAGLTFVSATPSQGSYNAATGLWNVGTVTPGAPQTLSLVAIVVSPNPQTNTATISHADQLDPNGANNSASVVLTVQTADLALAKSVVPTIANLGDTVTFTVVLTDNGPATATGVTVTDVQVPGWFYGSATPSQGTYDPLTGVWDVGTVTTSTPQTLTIQAQPGNPVPVPNTATITHADQVDPDLSNNSASATVQTIEDLAVFKTVNNPTPNVGDVLTFTVTLVDNSLHFATGVEVSDLLPPGLSFVSATPSQGTYDSATGLWDLGGLVSSVPQTLQIGAKVVSPNPQTNTATITHADEFDPNPGNNTASVTETPQQADLAIAKGVDNPTPTVGLNVTFTVTLSDNGPDAATNVTVADLLPAGLTFVSATPSQGTYNNSSGVWTVGTVTTAALQTLQILATVNSLPSSNTASITHADQFDPNLGNNTATVNLP